MTPYASRTLNLSNNSWWSAKKENSDPVVLVVWTTGARTNSPSAWQWASSRKGSNSVGEWFSDVGIKEADSNPWFFLFSNKLNLTATYWAIAVLQLIELKNDESKQSSVCSLSAQRLGERASENTDSDCVTKIPSTVARCSAWG